MQIVSKPWGRELWIELNSKYCFKRIEINAGERTSLQFHQFKCETIFIASGKAEVWLENDEGVVEKKIMYKEKSFNVMPGTKHRVIALTDLVMFEVSTPEVDDVIRVEDDTGRQDGRIDSEHN